MELALAILYLNKAETPDKICRAIQYGSKFVSNGEPGTAQNVDKSTSLATKVFRLFKFVSDLHAIISPTAPGTPLPLVLLGKTFSRKMATYISVQAFCPFTIWGLLMHIWNIFSKLIRGMKPVPALINVFNNWVLVNPGRVWNWFWRWK
ncbi:putative peroxisomal biogenesis factor 11 [Helianthus annuus]|uniref:Peroxisomal biogenesis factor 11 n=1 Tax=Helianthus annuus TaxID=4232 RepID=A0A9K3DT14_HELAN|nr:putative peroxisomal biogenesis factor 11 [Helianthus annuus]